MALHPVPAGHVASVVTHMEMRKRPEIADIPASGLSLEYWVQPALSDYRALFRKVGAPWLWFSRLVMDDSALRDIIHNPAVHVHVVRDAQSAAIGFVELDFRQGGECEIGFLGLVPKMHGKGYGRWLIAETLRRAWAGKDGDAAIMRVWLHSCTLDHPGALRFYERSGFTAFAREIEIVPDPRLTGHLPQDAAPQMPVISAES